MRLILLASLVFSLAATLPAAPAAAQSVAGAPPGSYLLTCVATKVDTTRKILAARCKRKDGTYADTTLIYRVCMPEIINYNGMLACEIDYALAEKERAADRLRKAEKDAEAKVAQYKQAMADARPALNSAAQVVMGRAPTGSEATMWATYLFADPATQPLMLGKLKFNDGVTYLKGYLASPERAQERQDTVDRAFREVWGRNSTPAELATHDAALRAKAVNYAQLLGKLRNDYLAASGAREAATGQAWQNCMGRAPTATETAQFKSQSLHYAQILLNCRAALYSPAGAKDLVETITRARTAANGKAPSDAEIKAAITQYGKTKAIFIEMAPANYFPVTLIKTG